MEAQSITQSPAPIVLDPADGEALWFNNDLLVLKAKAAETAGDFLFIEEHARRGKVTPLHSHPEQNETFYVLDGDAVFHLDGIDCPLGPGGFLSVPPGVPHAYLVRSETARLLILITPGSAAMEAFFRDAGEPAPQRTLPAERPLDIARIAAAAERTGAVTILGPPPFGGPGGP